MSRTWILIGSRDTVRIFERQYHDEDIVLVEELQHSAADDREVQSDREGRSINRSSGRRYAYSKSEPPRRKNERRQVHDVAEVVNRAAMANRFDDLFIVAEPKMLGDLRQALDRSALSRLKESVEKDFGNLSQHELATRLRELI